MGKIVRFEVKEISFYVPCKSRATNFDSFLNEIFKSDILNFYCLQRQPCYVLLYQILEVLQDLEYFQKNLQ